MISWQIPAQELMILQKDGQPWRLGQGGVSMGGVCGCSLLCSTEVLTGSLSCCRASSAWCCPDLHNVAVAEVSGSSHTLQAAAVFTLSGQNLAAHMQMSSQYIAGLRTC